MQRSWVRFSVAVIGLLGLIAGGRLGPDADAQEATPAATVGHPLVGTWLVDAFPDDPTNPPDLGIIGADGTVLNIAGGVPAGGAWEATGPRSAALTFVFVDDTEEFAGTFIIRAAVEVDAAGDAFAGPYSYTVVAADGAVLDAGEGTARAARVGVEPVEAGGAPLRAAPTWAPEQPAAATPAP